MGQCRYKGCSEPAEEGSEYCIFHEPGEKDASRFYGLISAKMERQDYYFQGYVFPHYADFRGATFHDIAYFWDATFEGIAGFGDAIFKGDACFEGTAFKRRAHFDGTTFKGNADFDDTAFEGYAEFGHATFEGRALFGSATFEQIAGFNQATFEGVAYFGHATFERDAEFGHATFERNAYFGDATFNGHTIFHHARCNDLLLLAGAKFKRPADETAACRLAQVTYRRFGDEETAAEYYLRKKRAETRAMRWYDPRRLGGHLLDILCKYGESPPRVVGWAVAFIAAFALVYWSSEQILTDKAVEHGFNLLDAFYFSGVTFTTLGYGDWYPNPNGGIRYVAFGEVFLGAVMIALLVVTWARKWMR